MKLLIEMENFPMGLAGKFTAEVKKYAEAGIAFRKDNTVDLHLDSKDIVQIQQVCIICDKYSIAEADAPVENSGC